VDLSGRDERRVTLVAYTHFGARGLKGTGMYYLVREAWKRGYVRRVVAVSKKRCRYEFDLDLVDTLPGQSRVISLLGKIRRKVWRSFPARWLGEAIFDRYAASRLGKNDRGLLLTTPGMIRTTTQGKALGLTTVLYAATPHPQSLITETLAEKRVFGLGAEREEDRNRSRVRQRDVSQMERIDYVIAISDYSKASYVAQGIPAKRVCVAPLGVDLERFRFAPTPPADERFTALFVGHVNETTALLKGLQYLLQAWSELRFEGANLVVCGKIGEEGRELVRRFEKRLGNVEFTGYVSNPAEYFHRASVFVFPSVSEGFGKVVLEAMASGRPVIATPIPSPVVRDEVDGFYVPIRDVEALKDRLLYFYRHRDEVARMGANARKRAERFSWEAFSVRVADFLEEVDFSRQRA